MLVGAYAVAAHGFPRATGDIDFVVHLPFEERERVRSVIAKSEATNIHERVDPQWGKRLAADLPSGLTIEIFLTPRSQVHDREYERRVTIDLEGEPTPVLSAEDLVLRKLVNVRLRRGVDFDDAIGILVRQGSRLDFAYLRAHAGFYRVGELLTRAIKEAEGAEP